MKTKLIASVKTYTEISFSESTEGVNFGFDGYISDNKDQLKTFLNKERLSLENISGLSFDTFAILKNLWVDEELRGKGLGSELLNAFLDRVETVVDVVFLIADSNQIQETGLDLKAWYESFGFKEVARGSAGPLMVLKGLKRH